MKPKVRFGLCYPSGAGGMFLTELVDNTPFEDSGCWISDTNPGCNRNTLFNEYGGSIHCVQVDGSTEALPVTDQSILVAKQDIHRYLPFYDCPTVYQIEIDEDCFDYTQELMFLKKWCAPCNFSSQIKNEIDSSGVTTQLKQYQSVDPHSKIVLQYVRHYMKDGHSFEDIMVTLRDTWISDGHKFTPKDEWDKSHHRQTQFNAEEIEKHSELKVINYSDLFLYGLSTDSIFDKYEKDIADYRKRNDKLLDLFALEFL